MRRNSLWIKVQVKNRLFTKNWLTRTEILLVSFLIYVIFSCHPSIAASVTRSLTTLFPIKTRGEETQPQKHQYTCLSNL